VTGGVSEDRRPILVLVAMSVISALIWMPTSEVPIALPDIHSDLGSSFTELQWMVNAYTLAVAALLVVMGRVGDLFGRRRLFLIGGAVFSLGALSAGLAQSTGWLIASVAVVGVGAAIAGPASLALIVDAFPARRQGRAIGVWGAASGVGAALGPMLGGLLTHGIDWRAIFWVNVPFVLGAMALAAVACRESHGVREESSVDVRGALSFGGALTALILALGQGGVWGWGSAPVLVLLAAAVVLGISFVFIDLRARAPLIPFREFGSRSFVIALVVLLIGNVVLASILFVLPLQLQNIVGHTALAAGVLLLPATATILVVSPLSGVITDRLGPRAPMVAGILCSALGVYLLSTIDARSDAGELIPGLIALGIGFGLQITPVNVAAVQAVPEARRATASGILLTTGMVGATLGIATFAAVFGGIARGELPDRLADAGAQVSDDDTETLDMVVTGSESAREAVGGFKAAEAEEVESAVDASFVSALSDVLKMLAALQLVAALFAAGLPRGRATEAGVAPEPATAARAP
jgi:EmrB/QacA subfamily drug resistance transporter